MKKLAVLALGLFVAACSETPTESPRLDLEPPMAFAAADVSHQPFGPGTFPVCGELVDYEGTFRSNTQFNFTPSGQVSSHTNYVIKVRGYGQTNGVKYEANQTGNFSFHVDDMDGLPVTVSDLITLRFVGAGDAADYLYKFRAHFTVDATGVVRVDRSDATIECS